jgi:hypothetical protein
MKAKEIEYKIKQLGTLKVSDNYKVNDIKQLLKIIIDERRPTYYTKNNRLQCEYNRARGLTDIYRTVLHYFPDTSFKQLVDIINSDSKCYASYCYTTAQTVFSKLSYPIRFNRYIIFRTKKFGGNVNLKNVVYE